MEEDSALTRYWYHVS